MMRTILRRCARGIAAAATALALAGTSACSTTLRDVPLPGSGVSGDAIEVTMEFAEALNLAEGAPVKINGVNAGKVKDVTARDFRARARVVLRSDAVLRRGATARLRYTTPLGELFVDVTNPAEGAAVRNGEMLTLAETSTAPTVEDALAQASLLINGGGLAQLQTVTEELNAALGGREGVFKELLHDTTAFLEQANATTADIDRALDALSSTSQALAARKETIDRALRQIRPAAQVLREETPNFTALLAELRRFADQANTTVGATRDDLLLAIREVEPVLAELAANESGWEGSLDQLTRLAEQIQHAVPGDYLNVHLNLHVSAADLLAPGSGAGSGSGSGTGSGGGSDGGTGSGGLLGGGLLPALLRTPTTDAGEANR